MLQNNLSGFGKISMTWYDFVKKAFIAPLLLYIHVLVVIFSLDVATDPAAGASDDWYKGALGTRFSFTTELRDTGRHGFILPKEEIIPSGEEMWAAFEVVIQRMIQLSEETTV